MKFFRVLFLRFRVSKTQNVKITVPLPLQRNRDRASATVTDLYGPFLIVTKRYMRYRTLQALRSVTERRIFYLTKNFKWTVLKLIYCLSIKLLFANMFSSFFI
jgi:hypothetical protein